MVKNSAIKMATGKLVGSPLLPGALILIGGIVVWRLWRKQVELQTRTGEMRDDLLDIKSQVAELDAARKTAEKKAAARKAAVKKPMDQAARLTSSMKSIFSR